MLIGPLGLTGDILQPVFAPTECLTPNSSRPSFVVSGHRRFGSSSFFDWAFVVKIFANLEFSAESDCGKVSPLRIL
jgi:hypothetical protein